MRDAAKAGYSTAIASRTGCTDVCCRVRAHSAAAGYVLDRDTKNTVAFTTSSASTPPPSAPSGLNAAVAGPTEVDLTWTASTDDVGVAGYRIYRNGTLVGTSLTNSYADKGLQPATSYSYLTVAYDAAGT